MPVLSASSASSSTTAKQSRLYPNDHGQTRPSRPGAGTASSSSSPGMVTPTVSSSRIPTPASTLSLPLKQHGGVRAHLADLLPLPRHALFDVKLTVHQLWNVPLVSGEFSVKWKFKHVHKARRPGSFNGLMSPIPSGRQTPDSAGFLSLSNGSTSGKEKGKGKMREVGDDNDQEYDTLIPSGASMLSIPSTSEGSSSSPSLSPRTNSMELMNDFHDDVATNTGIENGKPINSNTGSSGSGVSESSHEARGRTPYVALRDHHVKWGKTVTITVQMGIQRNTLELQPCELKLVVEQLSAPNDPSPPQNPRLGAVYLNLAEYVNKGAVTRRYLLRQSKTNATLQVTLELTHAGGETNYKAPPLQKGEVMAGVSALLEKSAVGGVPRPRPTPSPAFDRSTIRPPLKTHRRATDRAAYGLAGWNALAMSPTPGALTPGAEVGSAAGANTGGLKTTDNIIEAIFNPVPTSSSAPSPFTYYVPPSSRAQTRGMSSSTPFRPSPMHADSNVSTSMSTCTSTSTGSASADADLSGNVDQQVPGRPPSVAPSSAMSDLSVATTGTGSSHEQDSVGARSGTSTNANTNAHGNTAKKWWKKIPGVSSTSRPASPAPSVPSVTSIPSPQPSSPSSPVPSAPANIFSPSMARKSNSGSSLYAAPAPVPATSLSAKDYPASVRSSPGVLYRRNSERHEGITDDADGKGQGSESAGDRGTPENWSAPQIIIGSPTMSTIRMPSHGLRRPS